MASKEMRCPYCDFRDTRVGFDERSGVLVCPDCDAILGVTNW
ncbi:DUF3268 family zinc-finger domain-containing protein [Halorussus salilacus]|nr:DUF3268 family zinc-finger domain-containing protein [Halorussus salilacus]USZ67146.1 DUF3268 family zinc-finger domain-containing protein [Halorussus salilacus]